MTEKEAMEIIMQVAYDGEFPLNSNEAFGIACKCIEKQIPKEPISLDRWGEYYKCPKCNGYVTDSLGCRMKYCRECGQKIKWE